MPTGDQRVVRVLILEDDLDLRETLALILSRDTGFSVEVVADVVSCLERLRASDGNESALHFDVLLLDLVLRGGHLGTEVLREAATPGAPEPAPGRRLYWTLQKPRGQLRARDRSEQRLRGPQALRY